MALRPCLRCGTLGTASYCGTCQPSYRHPSRGSGNDARRFRAVVLARASGRCERCGSREDVEAHHRLPLHSGGTNSPANGAALCRRCHRDAHRHL